MKNLKFLQIAVLMVSLFLTAAFQQAKAQSFIDWDIPSGTPEQITGTFTGGTVTVTQGAVGNNLNLGNGSNSSYTNLNGAAGTQAFYSVGPASLGAARSLTFTFSRPVIINELTITDFEFGTGFYDGCSFSGVTFTSVSGANCSFTTTSATPTGNNIASGAEYARWLTSTTPISSFTINYPLVGGVSCAYLNYAMKVTSACVAGTAAPTLSATTISNVCPATTVDLTTITASNTPASTTLTWHTATPATTANKITGTAVAAGTYHAAFFDATANCYSPTRAVTATVSTCTTPVTVGTPASITGSTGTLVTGNPPTGVSGGTSPYTYSDGTGDALCTAPTSPTLALPAGRIVSLNGSTGAHNINTVGLGAGTYQYCIKVCDSSGTNCVISRHTIVVTAACNAGSAAPALLKN